MTELAGPHAPDLLRGDKPRPLQDADMLLHAREGLVKLRCKLRDRSVSTSEVLQNAASGCVRECGERSIKAGFIMSRKEWPLCGVPVKELRKMPAIAKPEETTIQGKVMTRRTAQETQNHYFDKMGPDLGLQFAGLWQEVVYAHIKWAEFMELYGSNAARVELLNRTAPGFFAMLQGVLFEETLLHIARLTDPSRTGKDKDNLSIRNLPVLVDHPETKQKLAVAVEVAVHLSDFCRDWRNRHIAHRDLALATGNSALALKNASKAQVKEALRAIADVLNIAEAHFADSETYFGIGRGTGGAVSLLYVLNDGMDVQTKREERLLAGEFSEDDIQRPV
jgi:hypothetical protein